MPDFIFSRRTDWELTTNRLNDELEALRLQGARIIDLTESNPTRCGLKYPKELLSAFSDEDNLLYAPDSKGMPKARQEVARRFASGNAESVVLTSSTSEAYAFLLKLLVNPGERVLIGRPSYPLFQYLIELSDAEYDFYPFIFDEGRWRIDFEALEEAVLPSTRVLILVNPNNPTGSYITSDELKRLNAFCRKHKLAIISDEVFFDYRLDGNDCVSLLGNQDVLTFVLGGLSKSLGLPQMKLSWIITSGPKPVVDEALNRLEIIADTFLSVNTPVQNALTKWFSLQKEIQAQIAGRVQGNYEIVRRLARGPVECVPSEGGWYAVLRVPSAKPEEEWILGLLREKHVFVHPGYFFDFEEEGYVVVSLLPAPEKMEQGLKKILEFAR